jgi:hypothetical protein
VAGAAGLFEALGDSQDDLVLMWPADDLHADGETLARITGWDGGARETGEIQPLLVAHGVEISRAGAVVSAAMEKRGRRGNWGEKDGDLLHLAEDFCAQQVALGAGFDERIERDGAA